MQVLEWDIDCNAKITTTGLNAYKRHDRPREAKIGKTHRGRWGGVGMAT